VFKLSLVEGTRQVESIPWVRSATLARAYPNRLAVHVVERVPVAFASVGGRLKLVDGDGVLLEKPERAEFDFPVLTGLDAAPRLTEGKQRLALYQDFQAQVAPEAAQSGWIISEVNLADADDLKALVVQGPETVELHFGDRDFVERFRSFLALLPEVRKTNAKLDSVDLRYENQIVVNPQKSSDQ
jgi:cell division protein FtsQ